MSGTSWRKAGRNRWRLTTVNSAKGEAIVLGVGEHWVWYVLVHGKPGVAAQGKTGGRGPAEREAEETAKRFGIVRSP